MVRVSVLLALPGIALQATEPAAAEERSFITPPKAAGPSGPIPQAEVAPIFRQPFMCSEHYYGQISYAGDALGADCFVLGGVAGDQGFSRPYRTTGAVNSDWYGWHAQVLSPSDGVVVGLIDNPIENEPGRLGKPPASMIQIEREDGVLITLGHITAPVVKVGDRLTAGQHIALVGNNGFSRAPHIHIGAYRLATGEPLQLRWDLRAVARLQRSE